MNKLFLILPLLLVGCTPYDAPEIKALNKANLSGDPEYVATLKDGRSIGRYRIDNGDIMHEHWVYVIFDNSSQTVNYSVSQGKTTRNETVVIINGKEYIEKSN